MPKQQKTRQTPREVLGFNYLLSYIKISVLGKEYPKLRNILRACFEAINLSVGPDSSDRRIRSPSARSFEKSIEHKVIHVEFLEGSSCQYRSGQSICWFQWHLNSPWDLRVCSFLNRISMFIELFIYLAHVSLALHPRDSEWCTIIAFPPFYPHSKPVKPVRLRLTRVTGTRSPCELHGWGWGVGGGGNKNQVSLFLIQHSNMDVIFWMLLWVNIFRAKQMRKCNKNSRDIITISNTYV